MKEEINRLFRFLDQLLDSCTAHDTSDDLCLKTADPDAYHAALDGIRDCIARINTSGIPLEELLQLFREPLIDQSKFLDGIVGPSDLLPLVRTSFTGEQRDLILEACDEWALSIAPDDPEPLASLIRDSVQPLTLAELLSPEITRMQQYLIVIVLQTEAQAPVTGSIPAWELGECILLPTTNDPVLFCGQMNPAIFRFLVKHGFIDDPCFPDLVFQALYDIGILRGREYEVFSRVFQDEGQLAQDLFEAGRMLFSEERAINDIRMLYKVAHSISRRAVWSDGKTGFTNTSSASSRLERLGGHVLAGYAIASTETIGQAGIGSILDFVRSVAARPSGRAEPGSGQLEELERSVRENEQLLRAVTGDYKWRAMPLPPGAHGRVVDLWPVRHLLLYDQDELAHRSPEAFRALVMEALYRYWFALKTDDLTENPWFTRLVSVITTQRAVRKGTSLHPGVIRWLEQFYREEYSPVNRVADRSRISRLLLPDQYLEAVLYEGRGGNASSDIRDDAVKYALDSTSESRKCIIDPLTTNEACLAIIRERMWPVFEQLCRRPGWHALEGSATPGRSRRDASAQLTPRGSASRHDVPVPSPHQPIGATTGRTIEGKVSENLHDDRLSIPGGFPGGRDDQLDPFAQTAGAGGTMPRSTSGKGAGGPGNQSSGISRIADDMMSACTESGNLLKSLPGEPGQSSRGDHAGSENCPAEHVREQLSALRELSRKIDDLAGALDKRLHNLREASDQETSSSGGRRPKDSEESDDLLKTSREVGRAAREYRKAVAEMEKQIGSADYDPGTIRHRTGMTRDALERLLQAGTEFKRLTGATFLPGADEERPMVRLPESSDDSEGPEDGIRRGRMEPAFVADTGYTPGVWESLSYFDAIYGNAEEPEEAGPSSGGQSRAVVAERRYEQETHELTREAEQYLCTLRERTRSDWETIDEKAERIRRIALLESHAIRQDDYAMYQRFYQPVAGLIGVARKNIQQALQKTRATRDMTELITGDDIDEENLAAVRTTMRIFKDRGREPDKTRWCLSLLIDASSSMHDETVARKLQATIQTAILFGEAVNRITGILFEIAAFSDTEYIPLKRYQDDWNIHQGCYLIRQVVQATGGTNDVGAVSSALDRMHRLRMAAGANRMIFVISDGQSGVGGREEMK